MPSLVDNPIDWEKGLCSHRLWAKDASLWTGTTESSWMGWLTAIEHSKAQAQEIISFADEIRNEGFTHILLVGMGGSSLCASVFEKSFGDQLGYPALRVLDSTDPAQIAQAETEIEIAKTLFVISSKSGTTLESDFLCRYFFEKARLVISSDQVGSQFVAITDPGTWLEKIAEEKFFRKTFRGDPDIGGRYSALSYFGMVPAALMGVDISRFLNQASDMAHRCAPTIPASENPGVSLGLELGRLLTTQKRDKLTFLMSPQIQHLGGWLEQLLAESTGKNGKGIIPIDGEPLGRPSSYDEDRIFLIVKLATNTDQTIDNFAKLLSQAGHPVIFMSCPDIYCLGAEFFRFEMATAVLASVIGVNPFDQPDVEASKSEARKLIEEPAALIDGDFHNNVLALAELLLSIKPGDYFNLSAFINMNEENKKILSEIRELVRDKKNVATCLGFGPRFLHSTGQLHKGGPENGIYLQITCDDVQDLRIPEQALTFGQIKNAQARGDLQVLKARGRRCLHWHISGSVTSGLESLKNYIETALN